MSWRLFKDTIVHAGHDYSLQTIPTLSSALEFDIRKNQPDFAKMLDKRMSQATVADIAKNAYQRAYGYTDYEIEQLDPDVYADEIMTVINNYLRQQKEAENMDDFDFDDMDYDGDWFDDAEENTEQLEATAEAQAQLENAEKKIYAGGLLSKEDLVSKIGGVNHAFDGDIIKIYNEIIADMQADKEFFVGRGKDLYGVDGNPYIVVNDHREFLKDLNTAMKNPDSRVYGEEEVKENDVHQGAYLVTDEFYKFLVSLPVWSFANGRFDKMMKSAMNQ